MAYPKIVLTISIKLFIIKVFLFEFYEGDDPSLIVCQCSNFNSDIYQNKLPYKCVAHYTENMKKLNVQNLINIQVSRKN